MSRIFIFSIVVGLIVFSCKNDPTPKVSEQEATKGVVSSNKSRNSVYDKLFEYIDSFPSLPNPFEAPSIFMVIVDTLDNDTIIEITSSLSLLDIIDSEGNTIDTFYKGICYVNDIPIALYDFVGFKDIDILVNPLNFDLSTEMSLPSDTIDFSKGYWTYTPPNWQFKISGGQLSLIQKKPAV